MQASKKMLSAAWFFETTPGETSLQGQGMSDLQGSLIHIRYSSMVLFQTKSTLSDAFIDLILWMPSMPQPLCCNERHSSFNKVRFSAL